MTWDAYHRRKDVLRQMLAIADHQREITLGELLDSVEGGRDAFPTEIDALFDLQMMWFQRLSGHMEQILSQGTESPDLVPVTAWVGTAAELPGARALLDAHRDEPALRKAFAKELSYLATAAGVPVRGADLRLRGQRIVDAARSAVPEQTPAAADPSRPGLIARLRSAIAA
ncbi:hypothetical protein [Aeromicrobium wangtongii]|uniref:hypothetical protein n=1 Tax=Aeromicrobium wangtongii TaxID=2969247 RepID=UPI002016C075|nr:hypothetical protein [Aeromicrobium wangtongii]MCL3818058.1 hypothetical protein [Aeromicrobium wangtongii]